MNTCRRFFTLIAMLALSACGLRAYSESMGVGSDPKLLSKLVSGATAASNSRQHGTQVEYLAPDGRSFLWYPGNRSVLDGRWKVEKNGLGADICFVYSGRTFNPATGKSGANWECEFGGNYIVRQAEFVDGDPLGLRGGKIPFVLSREWHTLADLMRLSGKPNTELRSRLDQPIL